MCYAASAHVEHRGATVEEIRSKGSLVKRQAEAAAAPRAVHHEDRYTSILVGRGSRQKLGVGKCNSSSRPRQLEYRPWGETAGVAWLGQQLGRSSTERMRP
jgi:hypothetical protein